MTKEHFYLGTFSFPRKQVVSWEMKYLRGLHAPQNPHKIMDDNCHTGHNPC